MKICYVTSLRLPTERPHGYAVAKMCESFAKNGHDVTLVSPDKSSFMGKDLFGYYGITHRFAHLRVRSLDLLYRHDSKGAFSYWIDFLSYALGLAVFGRKLLKDADIIYVREPYLALFMSRRKTILELHTLPVRSLLLRNLIRSVLRVNAISHGLAEDVTSFSRRRDIAVIPDAVDAARFATDMPRTHARLMLGLPEANPIAAYTGNFYAWKGVDTLADAAKLLPDVQVVLVGGTDEYDYQRIAAKAAVVPNLTARRFEDASRMPAYLAAADVLVIPNAKGTAISERHTSPLKLFEYMAAGRPIVASDLPSLKEILDADTAIFFTPDDPISLARAIRMALEPERARGLVVECKKRIGVYSWDARAASALKGL